MRLTGAIALFVVALGTGCVAERPIETGRPLPAVVAHTPASSETPSIPPVSSSVGASGHGADSETVARNLISAMGEGRWAAAARLIHPPDESAVDPEGLESAWARSVGDRGKLVSVQWLRREKSGDGRLVRAQVGLERGTMMIRMLSDADGRIVTVSLAQSMPPFETPTYSNPDKLVIEEVAIGEGRNALPGELVVPSGRGPFPIAILINGSGGGDRDESTEAGARPFRDIAEGLGTRGIATLRWDKRTSDPAFIGALGIPISEFTLEHEYLTDVGAAIALAEHDERVDPKRVFLIGHSMGGWLAPRFLKEHRELSGAALLAGNARNFLDILPEQYEYIARLDDGRVGLLEAAQIETVRKQCALARDPQLSLDTAASDLPFSTGPRYWRSIQAYDAVETARQVPQPILALQGGRDYQVTEKSDLSLWTRGLRSKQTFASKVYPLLNHDFLPGKGMATPAEERTLNAHVDAAVIEDLANWIEKGGGAK